MARRVLVVDDVAMNRQILIAGLGTEYEVMEAANGEEALALLHRHYKLLSAVLLDIVMPVLDGYGVLRRMGENPLLSQIPVIVITGAEDEASRVKALALGANDFITKPYNPDIIRHCLRNNIALRETASIVNAIQKGKLTGIYNREFFFEKADELIRSHSPGSYILTCLDIDNFKLINDQYGTPEGDRILKHIGVNLREIFDAENGVCGRISGDNFAGLFPNHPDISQRMISVHFSKLMPPDTHTDLHFSVGRYVVNDCSLPASALYDRAYIAKQSVKGRYDKHIATFDDSMLARLVREQEIISGMDRAITEHQFEVWFQPQYNHSTGALIGAEALVRWRHPEKGLISPADFIPVFEQNGFVYEVDKYVWEDVCRRLRKWIDEGRSPLPVSVNISRYDVFRSDLVDVLTGLIARYGIPVELLRLEVTESAFTKSTDQIIAVVEVLMHHGFIIEIDDFGSGYSSLNTLKDVPAQIVKLDMRFLEDSNSAQRGGNIVESIVRMTKWLNMAVIAEGVENFDQANFLKSIGCNYVQGYLYGSPMPAEEYENLAHSAQKEPHLIRLDTLENLDNNSFWDPKSLDTLIFNSYVGGSCIFEFHEGKIELLRANDKFVQVLQSTRMSTADALKLDWTAHLDAASLAAVREKLEKSVAAKEEFSGEYLFLDLPGCPGRTYLHSTLRIIASADDRHLVYCTSENVTARHEALEKLRMSEEENRLAVQQSGCIIGRFTVADRVLTLNPDIAEKHGIPAKITGLPRRQIRHGLVSRETEETFADFFEEIIQGHESGQALFQHKLPNGNRWLEAHYSTIFSDSGEPAYAVVSFFDVTERLEKETVYQKWQQSIASRPEDSYTLFRCNLSRNASFDTMQGSLLHIQFGEDNDSFNGRTREYLEQCVCAEDQDLYQAFMNTDTLLANFYRGKRYESLDYRENLPSGGYRWLRLSIELVEHPASSDVETYLLYENIDKEKRAELLMKENAETDPLTGVLNGATFRRRVEALLAASPQQRGALLMMDIDGFKIVNDLLGHSVGDRTLIDVASALRGILRREDLLGRPGGDEFLIYLHDLHDDTVAESKARQICALVRKTFNLQVHISASVGVVLTPQDGTDYDTLC